MRNFDCFGFAAKSTEIDQYIKLTLEHVLSFPWLRYIRILSGFSHNKGRLAPETDPELVGG